jgi:hypothetical protein
MVFNADPVPRPRCRASFTSRWRGDKYAFAPRHLLPQFSRVRRQDAGETVAGPTVHPPMIVTHNIVRGCDSLDQRQIDRLLEWALLNASVAYRKQRPRRAGSRRHTVGTEYAMGSACLSTWIASLLCIIRTPSPLARAAPFASS